MHGGAEDRSREGGPSEARSVAQRQEEGDEAEKAQRPETFEEDFVWQGGGAEDC